MTDTSTPDPRPDTWLQRALARREAEQDRDQDYGATFNSCI